MDTNNALIPQCSGCRIPVGWRVPVFGRGRLRFMSFCGQSRVCNIRGIPSLSFLRSLRSALSFHAISFGPDAQTGSLRRMVQIATEIHDTAPRDPFAPLDTPCSYSQALDTVRRSNQLLNKAHNAFQVQLANTFLAIADSLHNPRATLRRI